MEVSSLYREAPTFGLLYCICRWSLGWGFLLNDVGDESVYHLSRPDFVKLDRKGKVYKELVHLTTLLAEDLVTASQRIGLSTGDIAERLQLARTNVSKELNALLQEGKAIKIQGKPVLYLAKQPVEEAYQRELPEGLFQSYEQFQAKLAEKNAEEARGLAKAAGEISVFSRIIGAEDDLKPQVKQAQAAILYPPNGLHTMLIGPTGSGKTTFAGVMYRYAVEIGKLPVEAPYVIFNCADYAENAQLLMSHLFGHVKGAYTGAEREKKGLIDQANGGILFLDEVHRLPPEGQEMLFSLIDRGGYRRLGEAESSRQANILIIAATTEDPQAAILGTFLRRIPLIITLPGLKERSLKVRMKLICRFFREESAKIKHPLTVAKEVLKVLLVYQCPGNIGQLRNDIQLVCANAFVEFVTMRQEEIRVKLSQLSQRLKDGFISIDETRREALRSFHLNDYEEVYFDGSKAEDADDLRTILVYDDYQTSQDFYEVILTNAQQLYNQGLKVEQIKEIISQKAQEQMHRPMLGAAKEALKVDKEILSKIATPEIVDIVGGELEAARELFGGIDMKMVYGLALHMETLLERLRQGEVMIYPHGERGKAEYPEVYEVAMRMKRRMEDMLSVAIPEDEVAFIAKFLHSLKLRKEGNIQILVIAHGASTASNMADVAKTLLGYECIYALDMPLEERVEAVLQKAVDLVLHIDRGGGVLLLVDMGSLTAFAEIIAQKTGVPTRSVRMVSTPMVIEAARKAMMPGATLDEVEDSVAKMSAFIGGRVKVAAEDAAYFPGVQLARESLPQEIGRLLADVLVFLDAKKACRVLGKVLEALLAKQGWKADDSLQLKFFFHCACMIERVIRKEPLPYKKMQDIKRIHQPLFDTVKIHFSLVEEIFGIQIPDMELAYIVELFYIHYHAFSTAKNE